MPRKFSEFKDNCIAELLEQGFEPSQVASAARCGLRKYIKSDGICSISTLLPLQSSLLKAAWGSWLERCLMLVFCWLFWCWWSRLTVYNRELKTSLLNTALPILMKLLHLYLKNMESLLVFSQSHGLWESWESHTRRLAILILFRIQADLKPIYIRLNSQLVNAMMSSAVTDINV